MKDNFIFLADYLGVFGVCPPCVDDEDVPSYLCDPCDSTVLSGGIAGWVAKKCSYTFVDIEDDAEWITAIEDKNVFGRVNGSRISGGIGAPEFTEKKRGSCGQNEVVKQTRTVTLQDAENDATFSIDALYNFLALNYKGYEFGFVTCDGRFLGWFSNVYVKTYTIIAETDEDDSYWEAVFSFNEQVGAFSQTQLSFLLTTTLNVCWVTSIVVSGAGGAITMANLATLQMSAAVLPLNATNPAVVWSVATLVGGTATISVGGLLTATGVGTVRVTATAADGSGITGTLVITIS